MTEGPLDQLNMGAAETAGWLVVGQGGGIKNQSRLRMHQQGGRKLKCELDNSLSLIMLLLDNLSKKQIK